VLKIDVLQMLSPVFRDMMDIGESSTVGRNDDNERPKKRPRIEKAQEEIPVDDDAATLECMFSLLANPKSSNIRVWNVSTWLKTLEIADKYDYSLYESIFLGSLWERAAEGGGSALRVFSAAIELKHGALARYAARTYGDYACGRRKTLPVTWSLGVVEFVGFRAWYYLIQACEKCKPFAWDKVADHLELPAE
jgi:hypothetical protein